MEKKDIKKNNKSVKAKKIGGIVEAKKQEVAVFANQDEDNNIDNETVVLKNGTSIIEAVEDVEQENNNQSLVNFVDDNALRRYIEEISKFPLLSAEEERRLFDLYLDNGDQKAGQAIVMSHLRLVVKIAMQYRKFGINMMDVIAEGNVGLMIALQKFDRSKMARFSTYASLWIKAKVQEFILKSWNMVKIGSLAVRKQLLFNFSGIKKMLQISDKTDAVERDKKIAKYFGLSNAEYNNVISSMTGRETSLDAPIKGTENQTALIDTLDIGDDFVAHLQAQEEENYRKKIFSESLSILNERQRDIIFARYLSEKGKLTLDELSKKYGISKERVRQIEESAIKKLKQFAEDYQKKHNINVGGDAY